MEAGALIATKPVVEEQARECATAAYVDVAMAGPVRVRGAGYRPGGSDVAGTCPWSEPVAHTVHVTTLSAGAGYRVQGTCTPLACR